MIHELWVENDDEQTFCQAGIAGNSARNLLGKDAKLVWTCEAESYFDAMSQYYSYMNWGPYKSDYPEDKILYKNLR